MSSVQKLLNGGQHYHTVTDNKFEETWEKGIGAADNFGSLKLL